MIRLPVKYKEKKTEYNLTCKEAAKMVIPYIHEQLSDEELRSFVNHVNKCPDCREELETYYIVYKGLMQLNENDDISMNMIETLNEDLELSNIHLRNMSLFCVLTDVLKWMINISCTLLIIKNVMEFIWRI